MDHDHKHEVKFLIGNMSAKIEVELQFRPIIADKKKKFAMTM